jgi:hypothetical protein
MYLLKKVPLVPLGQRTQDTQPKLGVRLPQPVGSTKGLHVILFTA